MFVEEIIGAFTGQNRRNSRRNFALGTALGLLVGSATALLLAPQSGADTREDIQNLALKTKDRAWDLAQEGIGHAKRLARRAGCAMEDMAEDVEDGVENLKEGAERLHRKAARHARKMARHARHAAAEGADKVDEVLEDVEEAAKEQE